MTAESVGPSSLPSPAGPPSQAPAVRLGAFDIACVVIGGIIGVGIFFTPAQVASAVDTSWQVTAVWSLGGAIAILGALVFARLSRLAPGPGGVFEYILQGFGSTPAFLYGWCNLLIIQSGALALVALLLVSNLAKAIGDRGDGGFAPLSQHLIATAVILSLTFVNIAGLRLGKAVQNTLTVIKTAAVFAVVATALLVEPATRVVVTVPERPPRGLLVSMSVAILPVLFSFGGWQHGSYVASVARRPHRDVPVGIITGVVVVVVAYITVNLAYLDLLGFAAAGDSETIAVDAMQAAFGGAPAATTPAGAVPEHSKIPQVFAALIVLSCAGLMNTICMAPPYVLHTMARRGLFFDGVGRLHSRFGTPVWGIFMQGAWACTLLWSVHLMLADSDSIDSLDFLLNGVVFVDWLGFGVCGAALVVLLRRQAVDSGERVGFGGMVLGGTFALVGVVVTLGALVTKSGPSLVGLGVLLVGLPANWWFRTRRGGSLPSR